jgi:hypothetical protein
METMAEFTLDKPSVPLHELFNGLDEASKRSTIGAFLESGVYSPEELYECVLKLDFEELFWKVLKTQGPYFLKHYKLWTDATDLWRENMRSILQTDRDVSRDVVYRYVNALHPETQRIPDFTYGDAYRVVKMSAAEGDAYVKSILPRTYGYLTLKKTEYASMLESSEPEVVAKGRELAVELFSTQYHPFVANYIWWPASDELLILLLRQELEWRDRILTQNDKGWTPRDYIDLCRGIVARKY